MRLLATRVMEEGMLPAEGSGSPSAAAADSWVSSIGADGSAGRVDLRNPLPDISWTEVSSVQFPSFGETFLGFRLVTELGRGAFGRVYLAHQDDLAQRLVALKVSTEVHVEAQNLAQLQHTHIVPVYSLHRSGALHAVCMPYLGSATLADVLRDLQASKGPPESGRGMVSTIQNRVGRTRACLGKSSASHSSMAAAAVAPSSRLAEHGSVPQSQTPPAVELPTLRMLEGLSHVDAVLWLGERLAEALAHAHERGILHGDLKPANILLTDDGQPMLLDFNLSTDVKASAARARVGGTLPYMAPEHLASFAKLPSPFSPSNERAVADGRSDVYALGIVLFELLTGRAPFESVTATGAEMLPEMIRVRLGTPPRLRCWNRTVSPAVESIVRHCLEPDPARRYQSARQLVEDLQRQRADRPLAHAPEASIREGATKWLRRNRRNAVITAGAAAAGLILCLVGGLKYRSDQLARRDAESTLASFHEESDQAHLRLAARARDSVQQTSGLRLAYQALGRYKVLENPDWRRQPHVTCLPPIQQDCLARDVGKLLLLTATAGEPERRDRLSKLAAGCFPGGQIPRASDDFVLGRQYANAGEYALAIKHLKEAARVEPEHFAAWYLLGNCYLDGCADSSAPEKDAVGCYSACIARFPAFYGSYFNRGLAHLRLANHAEAKADFDKVLRLDPKCAAGLLYRGIALEELGKTREALADLNEAIRLGKVPSRAYFVRSNLRRELGDLVGASRDYEQGLECTPPDEESYLYRGAMRLPYDRDGAMADFRAAVRCNPHSVPGRFKQAQIYADYLNQPRKALELLDQIVRKYPHLAPMRSCRGLLYARLGQRKAAHEDARQACAKGKNDAQVFYRAACIHALTSATHAGDRDEALRLLNKALRLGFGHDRLEDDIDLQPLRDDERFRKIVDAVRGLKAAHLEDRPPLRSLSLAGLERPQTCTLTRSTTSLP